MFVELIKEAMGQKPGYRFDTDEAIAKAMITQGQAKAIADDPLAPVIAKSMETMLDSITKTLTTTIDATLKEFAAAQSKSRKNAVPAIFGEGGNGDPKKTFGAFLLAVYDKDVKALEAMGSKFCEWNGPRRKTAMSTQTGANGGFLVPTEFRNQIMIVATEKAFVRPRATIIPMTSKSVQIPSLDHATTPSAGDSAFLGGVVVRWTEEATAINETEPNLKQIELINYEMLGYSKVSNTLLQDEMVGLEAFLYQIFGRAIGWYEDYAFLRGNGAGKPLGIQNWPGLISVTRTTSNLFKLADVANMYGRLLPGGDEGTIAWVVHPTIMAQLIQMTGGDNIIFLGNDLQGKPKMKILNYDVVVSEKVPGLGTANDVTLCDFQHYVIGDRQALEIAYSEHAGFTTNQALWRFVNRIGGMPWMKDKITLSDATNTLSPFVGLAA